MKEKEPTLYIREMIQHFRMPGQDYMTECMFSPDKNCVWDSGVFISTNQSKGFYTDVFQFWVRAYFCFCEHFFEKMVGDLTFQSAETQVNCQQIPTVEFVSGLLKLVKQHLADMGNREADSFPESFSSLQERSFSNAFLVLDSSDIQSSVAESDGEFIAYFHLTKNCTLPK